MKRSMLAALALCGLSIAQVIPSAPPDLPSVSLPPELARVLSDYEKSWVAKDAKNLAALFAEDGFVLQGGRPPVRGRSRIEAAYRGAGGELRLRALAYALEGDIGYVVGGYAQKIGDPDVGKFTLTLRKEKGRWLIFSDMDNGNSPRP